MGSRVRHGQQAGNCDYSNPEKHVHQLTPYCVKNVTTNSIVVITKHIPDNDPMQAAPVPAAYCPTDGRYSARSDPPEQSETARHFAHPAARVSSFRPRHPKVCVQAAPLEVA
jgi:hypothetical protein